MLYKHTFDNSNNIVQYGFELVKPKNSKLTIEYIVNNVSEGIIVFDTKNIIFSKLISKCSRFINDNSKKFVAVVDATTLNNLSSLGLKSGFIRSTKENSKLAVIVVDKQRVYIIVDENHIFEADSTVTNEVFNYINHIIWSKTDFEVIQGLAPNQINSIRLSIVKPDFEKIKYVDDLKRLPLKESTIDFNGQELLISTLKNNTSKAHQIIKGIESAGIINNVMYLNPFEDYYVPVEKSDSIYLAHSFNNVTLNSIVNKQVWINGREQPVEPNLPISKVIYKPVDEYKDFKPDFNQFTNEVKDKQVCNITIELEVKPIVIDKSYTISPRYEKIKKVNAEIQSKLEDFKKLMIESKEGKNIQKQVEKVEKERDLISKIKLYNQLIEKIKIGDDALLDKKDKRYQPIIVTEKDIKVPSDLIGILYEKQKNLFFGIKSEERIVEAKRWILDCKETATLVLMNE